MTVHLHDSTMSQHDDYESDSEIALDLKGRKHVDRSNNSDGVYWLREDTQSSYIVFPVPGKASANAFRKFLECYLPPHLITDEFGHVKPIADIADDHLPVLQAQMWQAPLRQSRAPIHEKQARMAEAFINDRSDVDLRTSHNTSTTSEALLFACHITFIAGLLYSNHIFVLGAKTASHCEFPSCASRSDYQHCPASILTVEPLVHWGTITPAIDVQPCRGSIQAFRRNGEKCNDPLWTQAIKACTPQHPTSYCLECLSLLFENRATAWKALEQSSASSFTAIKNSPTHPIQAAGMIGLNGHFKGNNKAKFTFQGKETARGNESVEGVRSTPCESFVEHTMDASPSLDGACDTPSKKDNRARTSSNGLGTMSFKQQGDNVGGDNSENLSPTTGFQPSNEISIMRGSTTVIEDNVHGDHTAISTLGAVKTAPCLLSSPATDDYRDPQLVTLLKKAGLRNDRPQHLVPTTNSVNTSLSFTPNQGTKRKFGRELNTNVILKSHKEFTMATANAKLATTSAHGAEDIRKFFPLALTSAKPTQAEDISTTARIMLPPCTTPPEGNGSETSLGTASTNSPAKTSAVSSPPSPPTPTAFKAKESPICSSRPSLAFKKFPSLKPINPTKTISPSPTPFFAKRPEATPCPPEISEYTYIAYTSRAPTASENICTCSRPASTPTTQIAQCVNADCAIGWYHYGCLDKAGKISVRHGRWTCRVCKNDQEFKDKDKEMGWTVEKIVEAEMRMPYEAEDILANSPGVGGVQGCANPYGLGLKVEYVQERKEDKGALGELGFLGYVASKPRVVSEVYMAPGRVGDRRMVEIEMEEEYEDWEYNEEYEEGFVEDVEGVEQVEGEVEEIDVD